LGDAPGGRGDRGTRLRFSPDAGEDRIRQTLRVDRIALERTPRLVLAIAGFLFVASLWGLYTSEGAVAARERESRLEEALSNTFAAFPVALGLIYMLLATLFRSYLQPVIVMTAVPVGFAGIAFGLLFAMFGTLFVIPLAYATLAISEDRFGRFWSNLRRRRSAADSVGQEV
jgi:hypothetical protein